MTWRSMRTRRSSAAALALIVLTTLTLAGGWLPAVSALHEDQVGSFDWHQQFVGEVTQAAFAGSKGNKRAFVSTAQGAIGALEFKTGEIGACGVHSCASARRMSVG